MILLFLEQRQNHVITLIQILQGLLLFLRDKVLGLAIKNICNLTTRYTSGFCHHCLVIKSSPTLWQLHGLQPTRLLCPWDFPGKNTGVGYHFLLQGIFLTQGSSLHLLYWQLDTLPLSHQGRPPLALLPHKIIYFQIILHQCLSDCTF